MCVELSVTLSGKPLRTNLLADTMNIGAIITPTTKSSPVDQIEEDQLRDHDTSNSASSRSRRGEKMHKRGRLSSKQKRLIQHWKADFWEDKEDVAYQHEHVVALATAIRSEPEIVLEYLKQKHYDNSPSSLMLSKPPDISTSGATSPTPQDDYKLVDANAHLAQPVLTLIDKYVSACHRRRSQTDGRRTVNTGRFQCTFGCGYRTKRPYDWRRHEETHEPQELWLCDVCLREKAKDPFLVNRRDKFCGHVTEKHPTYNVQIVIDRSNVRYIPRVPEGCPFCNIGEASKGWSWDDRCKHILGHYESDAESG